MEDGARGAAFETAPRTVIQLMDGEFHRQSEVIRRAERWKPVGISGTRRDGDGLKIAQPFKAGWLARGC